MKFSYTAVQPDGSIVRGTAEAASQNEVLDALTRKELKPVSIDAEREGILHQKLYFSKGITATDTIFLTKYLALMLRVGTDLFRALDILISDFEKPAVKRFLAEVRESLEKGQPFYTVFARYPRQFEPVFVNLIKAGELSGNLESVFDNLSIMLQKQEDLRRRVMSALMYPSVLLVTSTLIMGFLVTFALPRIADMFLQGDLKPPAFSLFVFTVSKFMAQYLYVLLPLIAVIIAGLAYFFLKTVFGRSLLFRFLYHVPVVKTVLERIAIQRFASTLGSLMRAGLPIIDSLDLTATAVGNSRLQSALGRIAHEGVARGLTLGDAFKRERAFPMTITTLIAVSEKAGHLDEVLSTLSTFYESEIDSAIKNMVSLIEPAMLLIMGGVVGFIALSVIVPVYQLIGQF